MEVPDVDIENDHLSDTRSRVHCGDNLLQAVPDDLFYPFGGCGTDSITVENHNQRETRGNAFRGLA